MDRMTCRAGAALFAMAFAAPAFAATGTATPPPPAETAAAADPMEGQYGNTQIMTGRDGKQMKVRFNRDKTVVLTRPDGQSMTGEWALEGDQICIKMTMMLMTMKRCMPFAADKKPGDVWTQLNPQGEEVTATIVPGSP